MYYQAEDKKWYGPEGYVLGVIGRTRFAIKWDEDDAPGIGMLIIQSHRSVSGANERMRKIKRWFAEYCPPFFSTRVLYPCTFSTTSFADDVPHVLENHVFYGKMQKCMIYQIKFQRGKNWIIPKRIFEIRSMCAMNSKPGTSLVD